MKVKKTFIIKYIAALLPFISVLAAVTFSLSWGLPNKTVNAIVMPRTEPEKEKIIKELAASSDTNIKKRSSFVIEGQEQADIMQNKLRIARRYFMYTENPDEMLALAGLAGINPAKLRFKPKCFQYGGGYIYPMGAMVAAGKIMNNERLNLSIEEIIRQPESIATAYIWGRALNIFALTAAFIGLAIIFYACGFSKVNALFAGGIVISAPAVINWASILKPHLLGTAFLVLSAGVVMLGQKSKHLKKFFWAAMILAGFASSAQYLMVGAGIIPCLLILQNSSFKRWTKVRIIAIGILLAAITFFLFNPYHLFYLDVVLADIKRAGSFYSPEFFNIKIPAFALWIWFIGSGFIAVPLLAGLFIRGKNGNFIKQYNYFIITTLIFAYYGSAMCVSCGFNATMTRFFLPAIILTDTLLLIRLNMIKNPRYRKFIFTLLSIAAFANIWIMAKVLREGRQADRPYLKASEYLAEIYPNYKTVYALSDTPAPYKMPAFNIYRNIETWNGELGKNELLVSNREIPGLKLLKSFRARNRYFKMSFAEKDFFFYINKIHYEQ